MIRRLSGFRATLTLLVILSIFPALGLTLYTANLLRTSVKAIAKEQAVRALDIVSDDYQRIIYGIEQLLITLPRVAEIQNPDPKTCAEINDSIRDQFPQYINIGILKADGTLLCDDPKSKQISTMLDPSWSERVMESSHIISSYLTDPVSGESLLFIGYPVHDSSGKNNADLTITFDINNFFRDIPLPEGATVYLINTNGAILARYPENTDQPTQTIQDQNLIQSFFSGKEDTIETSSLDNTPQLLAISGDQTISDENNIVLAVGIPTEIAYSRVSTIVRYSLIGLVLTFIFSMGVTWLGGEFTIIRRTKALIKATQRFAAGDFSVRSGLSYHFGELGQIAFAFDNLANSLEAQHKNLLMTTEDLRQSEEKFRMLTETSPAAIVILQDNHIVYANPSALLISGYKKEELIDQPVWVLLHPKEIDLYKRDGRKSNIRELTSGKFEVRIRTHSGEERWLDYNSTVIEYNGKTANLYTGFETTNRKRAEQAIKRKLDELEVLYAVAQTGMEATNLDDLIGSITHIIGDRLFPYNFGILVYDKEHGTLSFHPSYDAPNAFPWITQPCDQGVTGHVIQTGESFLSGDVTKVPFYVAGGVDIRSEISVPIWAGGEIFGVINAESCERDAFSDGDKALLEAIANQMATGIEKVTLLEAERRRREEADTLREASVALTSSLDSSQVIVNILINLEQVIPYDTTSVMLIQGDQLRIVSHRGSWSYEIEDDILIGISTSDHILKVLETHQPFIIPDTSKHPSWFITEPNSEPKCWMGIPLLAKGQVIGLINLEKIETDYYTEEDAHLALAFANQAASALENARLFTEERSRTRELEIITETSARVRLEQNRSDIVTIILDQVMRAAQAEGAVVAFRTPHANPGVIEQGRGIWSVLVGETISIDSSVLPRSTTIYTPPLNGKVSLITPPYLPLQFDPHQNVAYIPLIGQDQAIGTLYVGKSAPFTDEEVRILNAICDISANAIHRIDLFEQTEQNLRRMSTLRTIDMAITSSINLRLTLDILIQEAMANLKMDAADFLLVNSGTRTLECATARGFRHIALNRYKASIPDPFSTAQKTPVMHALIDRQSVYVSNIREIDPVRGVLFAEEGFSSAYIIPLSIKGEIKGVMEIFHRETIDNEPEWLGFLEALAGQAAIAIDNVEMFNNLEHSNQELSMAYDATIEGWSRALDLRDRETEGHTLRVTDLTLSLAREMNIPEEDLVHVRRGSLLHDIGKMGIPDTVLLKPGMLTDDEWKIMRQHPVYAYQLLSPITFLQSALDIPYCHHEKWDGTGYPRKLKRLEIPLSARIFAIVDVWDALCSDRPYRKAWTQEKAMDYIRSQSGSHFDPQIVDAFLQMIEKMQE